MSSVLTAIPGTSEETCVCALQNLASHFEDTELDLVQAAE